MSFGQRPQTVENNPYKGMPSWVRDYYQSMIARSQASDNRADALRVMFSGSSPQEMAATDGYRSPGANPVGSGAPVPTGEAAPPQTGPAPATGPSGTEDILARIAAARGSASPPAQSAIPQSTFGMAPRNRGGAQ